MKRYLAERFSAGRWNLCADIDELFEYPLRDRVPLPECLAYLNARDFSIVVAQMLDLFSGEPLADVVSAPGDRLWDKFPYYDLQAMDTPRYEWSGCRWPAVRMHWGGIRRQVFGTSNGLTKAALVRMDGCVKPFVEWHHAVGGTVADVTCVLKHYPFVGGFVEKVREAVRTSRYGRTTTAEYEAYARALEANPRLTLRRPSAQRFAGLQPLIDSGFLVVSDEYRRWAERCPSQGADVAAVGGAAVRPARR
jgi:hypothetical protein